MYFLFYWQTCTNVRYDENTEFKVILRSLEVLSVSFEFFDCFVSLGTKINNVLVMHSKDTGPVNNLALSAP